MSKYDYIFKAYAKSAEKLTPLEALFAITMIVVYADGKRSDQESELLKRVLVSGAVKDYLEEDFRKTSMKIDKIWDAQGTAALFNAATAALPKDMREEAYAVAVAFAIADSKVAKKESQYLDELSQALEIPKEIADKIIADCWEKHRSSD